MRPNAEQVLAVRRRFVEPQVRLLRRAFPWASLLPEVVADCVLAAAGDAVATHRLMLAWADQRRGGPRTPDITAQDEDDLVAYIRTHASSFACDCGTCGPTQHGSRFMHPAGKP